MITLTGFGIGYNKNLLVESADIVINKGTLTAFAGRNGTGKSTVLRAFASLNREYSGTIKINGKDVRTLSAQERASLIAYVSTERLRVSAMNVRQAVELGRAPFTGWTGRLKAKDQDIVDNAMRLTGVEHLAQRMLDTLSDGEYKNVMTARAVAQDTPVLLLDEPTSYLDVPNRHRLCNILRALADQGRTIIFSTHEIDLSAEYATGFLYLHNRTLKLLPDSASDEILDSMLGKES